MKRMQSFANRLTRIVVITVLVIMTIISLLVFLISAAGIYAYSKEHYSDMMAKARGSMALVMSKVEVSANNIIDEISWHLETPELVANTLQYELNTNRHLYGCGIGFLPDYYDRRGYWYEPYVTFEGDDIVFKSIGSEHHDYFNADWYQKGLESREGVWSNPYFDEAGAGALLCTFSRQVTDPYGTVAGVFGADLSLEGLSNLLQEWIRKENENDVFYSDSSMDTEDLIYCFILGPDGSYIVHPDKERILNTNFYDYADGPDDDRYRELGDAMRAGESGDKSATVDGIPVNVYYGPLMDSGWSMGIVVPRERLVMPALLFGGLTIFIILIGLLIIFFICRQSIQHASRPLIRLAESAREVATGNFDTPLPEIRHDDEIRLLRDSFDHMQQSLSHYIEELTETTAQKASMESELDVARNIQMSMLPMSWPAFPERKDLDIYGSVTPAKAVGGDLYDFGIENGKLFFCIGDVSGKGIPASLVMTVISSMFRTLSGSEDSPVRIVSAINEAISARNDSLMFVTLFVGILDLATGELDYANAGHNAPVVISEDGPHMLEVDANIPIGIVPDWDFTLQHTRLAPGAIFFLYTDGLTEAARSGGELFEEKRVLENLTGLDDDISTQELVAHMLEAVNAFVGDSEQSDDLTMLALRLGKRA